MGNARPNLLKSKSGICSCSCCCRRRLKTAQSRAQDSKLLDHKLSTLCAQIWLSSHLATGISHQPLVEFRLGGCWAGRWRGSKTEHWETSEPMASSCGEEKLGRHAFEKSSFHHFFSIYRNMFGWTDLCIKKLWMLISRSVSELEEIMAFKRRR